MPYVRQHFFPQPPIQGLVGHFWNSEDFPGMISEELECHPNVRVVVPQGGKGLTQTRFNANWSVDYLVLFRRKQADYMEDELVNNLSDDFWMSLFEPMLDTLSTRRKNPNITSVGGSGGIEEFEYTFRTDSPPHPTRVTIYGFAVPVDPKILKEHDAVDGRLVRVVVNSHALDR